MFIRINPYLCHLLTRYQSTIFPNHKSCVRKKGVPRRLGSFLFWGMASDSGEWFLAAWRPARLRPCALRFAGGLGPDVSGLRRSGAARCLMESGTFRCPGVQVSLHPGAQKCRFVGDAAARFSGASAFRFPVFPPVRRLRFLAPLPVARQLQNRRTRLWQ